MPITFVNIQIKPEYIEQFIKETMENAKNSIQEKGCIRFDVFQEENEPTKFVLVEIFQSSEDVLHHKETSHYIKWRDNVTEMMAETRYSKKFRNLFPENFY